MDKLLEVLNTITKDDIRKLHDLYADGLLPPTVKAVLEVLGDSIMYSFSETETGELKPEEQEDLKRRGFGVEKNSKGIFLVNIDVEGKA